MQIIMIDSFTKHTFVPAKRTMHPALRSFSRRAKKAE